MNACGKECAEVGGRRTVLEPKSQTMYEADDTFYGHGASRLLP